MSTGFPAILLPRDSLRGFYVAGRPPPRGHSDVDPRFTVLMPESRLDDLACGPMDLYMQNGAVRRMMPSSASPVDTQICTCKMSLCAGDSCLAPWEVDLWTMCTLHVETQRRASISYVTRQQSPLHSTAFACTDWD
jgi:hypothetical protein